MQDLNDLYFYAQVVEHGGFTAAGRALHQPKSKLSRRIALLEERLGVRLIQRSSRRFAVTEIGQEFYRHCQAMLVEAEAAQEVIAQRSAEPQGLVRLSCPPALLYYQLGDMLARFMVAYPKVQVQMEVTNRNVDILGEGIDVGLRVRFPPLGDSDLVMKALAVSPQCLVVHPRLLGGDVLPQVPSDLARLPTVGLGNAQQQYAWTLDGPEGKVEVLQHAPRLVVNDMVGVHQAVLHGVGVAPLPTMMVQEALLEGRLVALLPKWRPRSGIVHAVFPSRRGLLPAVRTLVDFLAAEFSHLAEAGKGYELPGAGG